ncbi:MAG: hypothetical protein JO035_10090, partial [Betaproteobacteria bacterium]|nr:hypothetical protein [Betaproteobacteria bacterium]
MRLLLAAALGMAAGSAPCFAQDIARIEVRPLESVTLNSTQFLNGERTGKPVILAGELRLPRQAPDRVPAVILVHGSGGMGPAADRWAQELNSIGVAAFILDSFSG